ncbi:hypothetical protein [Maribacter sp. 2308TA10-17]|uniref:hypothetical protein n=1 Tax=Maribacter sp. 2308TA10-17 TaxID=3386276 RepID=UPI0039BC6275
MKKEIYLKMLICVLIFNSCSDDNEETGPIGSWNSISIILTNPFDFDGDGIEDNDAKAELPCLNHSFVLNSDGTGQYTSNLASLAPQPSTSLYTCSLEFTNSIEWTESNGTISIIGTQSDVAFQINIIDNNSLERILLGFNDIEEGRIIFKRQ